MANDLFRKSALETLSSPEQLNQLVRVTRPRSWIALGGLFGLLLALVLWGFLGSLPTRVSGRGVIIHDGGTFEIVAAGAGVITGLDAWHAGDSIHRGQVLGRIGHPALEQQIAAAAAYVERLSGAVPGGGAGAESRLSQAQQRLHELELSDELESSLVSERDGVVVEMLVGNGDTVKEGQPVLSIESGHSTLYATIYLPAGSKAKLLRPGMEARVSPVTSESERYGYLIGTVRSVSKYPATEAGMMALLNNAALVRELSPHGAPIAVSVAFEPDPATRSGFRWSSSAGAAVELSSGTLCAGTFILESHRPIGLVFPMLRDGPRGG